MDRLFNLLEKHSKKQTIFIGIVIIILFNVIFLPMFPKLFMEDKIPLESILDLKFSYSPETSYQVFTELKNEGRKIYRLSEIFIDLPYAIIYGFTYAILTLFLLNINKLISFKYLSIIPILLSFFDILENSGIIIMLSSYPEKLETISNFSSFFTSLKWIFAGITFVLMSTLLIRYFFIRK